jgi:predicted amidohydrolase YtcJ
MDESAAAGDPSKDRNVTIIHSQCVRKDQLDTFVQYKIRPSYYTLHTYYFAEAHIANRGNEQSMHISPMRDAIDRGSFEVGKRADLVVLDKNPLKVEPIAIKEVKVLETIKDGKSIYKRP